MATACGCDNVIEVQDKDLGPVLQKAIDDRKMTVIVCKCDSGNIKLPVITMDPAGCQHPVYRRQSVRQPYQSPVRYQPHGHV